MSAKACFVIAPIGDKGTDARKRSDQVLRHIITPPVISYGYEEPVRADHIAEPGMITSQVIQLLSKIRSLWPISRTEIRTCSMNCSTSKPLGEGSIALAKNLSIGERENEGMERADCPVRVLCQGQ
jgi:hypothetical protein